MVKKGITLISKHKDLCTDHSELKQNMPATTKKAGINMEEIP